MSKIFTIILLTLLSATFTFAQSKSNEQIMAQMKSYNVSKNIQLEYDKSSDYSKLLLLSNELTDAEAKKNGLSTLTFGLMYGYNGREMSFTPDVFILTFWANGKKTNFAQSHNWQANVDGEMVDLGEAKYRQKSGDSREFLNFAVTRENLNKITQGKNVSFTLGNYQLKFSPETLKMLENILTLSDITK